MMKFQDANGNHVFNEGEFQECDFGKYFTYRKTDNLWAIEQGFLHEVDVLDGVRFARVLKTVAYVCVDEDEYGKAVFEKWNLQILEASENIRKSNKIVAIKRQTLD